MERSSTPGTLNMWPQKKKTVENRWAVSMSSQTPKHATTHATSTKPTRKAHNKQQKMEHRQRMEHHPWTSKPNSRAGAPALNSLPLAKRSKQPIAAPVGLELVPLAVAMVSWREWGCSGYLLQPRCRSRMRRMPPRGGGRYYRRWSSY